MVNSNFLLERGIIEKLRYAIKIKQVNEELAEQLRSSLLWLIHYSEKYDFDIPEKDKIIWLIDRSMEIEGKLSINRNVTGRNTNRKGDRTGSR